MVLNKRKSLAGSTPVPSVSALKTDECATVQSTGSKCLADLGFVNGAEIKMVRPGSTCLVQISGRHVGLGNAYQRMIQLA